MGKLLIICVCHSCKEAPAISKVGRVLVVRCEKKKCQTGFDAAVGVSRLKAVTDWNAMNMVM